MRRFLVLFPAALLAGCIQGERIIKLNADGSGTIEDTVNWGEKAKSLRSAMESMDQTPAPQKAAKRKEKLATLATRMGEGVTLVSSDELKGGAGEKTVYAFKDVSKLKVACFPSDSMDDPGKSESSPLMFRLARQGATSVLTVAEPPSAKSASKKGDPAKKPTKEEQAQATAMMKTMMAGLKVACRVQVPGSVTKASGATPSGSMVTLVDIDFDQLASDEAALAKVATMEGEPDPKALAGIKGLKMPTGDVTIEFSAR